MNLAIELSGEVASKSSIFGVAYHEEGGFNLLVGDLLDTVAFQTQNLFVERDGGFETFDRDADVFDV